MATALDPTAGQFVFEGNDPAPRTFAFTFNINYAPGGSAPVALQIIKNGIVMDVPNSEENRHYQEIQQWISEGNTVIDNNE